VIPDRRRSLELHEKYGSGDRIIKHCVTVASVAEKLSGAIISKGGILDREAALAGALLHDIGRSRVQTVNHGYIGADILKDEGVDAIVVEIVKRHVGAGISPEEAKFLGFPDGDYIPRTIEQKVVCFSDKMVSTDTVQPFVEEERRFIRKGHDVERLRRLRDEVTKELGQDPETLVLPARQL
jgi:uncharacterized protein (TIGR00295 family)